MARRHSDEQYDEWACQGIIDLLSEEHAVLWSEAQAKISDRRWPKLPYPIDPHHMTNARRMLLASGRIVSLAATTRGGGEYSVLHLSDLKGRRGKVERAAARKRLLAAAFNSWTTPTAKYPTGLIGGAGERVVRASIAEAARHGLRLTQPGGGEVSFLLGDLVDGGPLDSAVWTEETDEYGQSVGSVLCPIEVKNIRHWVYPNAQELYQLLYKAARLRARALDVRICPVLITRRKSYSTNQMTRDLGFRVIDIQRQFVAPAAEVSPERVEEIRNELGFLDLERTDQAHPALVSVLSESLIESAPRNAARWATNGAALIDHYDVLRDAGLTDVERNVALGELREAAAELPDALGGW